MLVVQVGLASEHHNRNTKLIFLSQVQSVLALVAVVPNLVMHHLPLYVTRRLESLCICGRQVQNVMAEANVQK